MLLVCQHNHVYLDCTTDIDVVFLLDASASVGYWNFRSMKDFVVKVIENLI